MLLAHVAQEDLEVARHTYSSISATSRPRQRSRPPQSRARAQPFVTAGCACTTVSRGRCAGRARRPERRRRTVGTLLSGGGKRSGCRSSGSAAAAGGAKLLERVQAHLDLRDLELQLLARAAELPAPQLRELDLQALDLQAVLAHQALEVCYIIGGDRCLGHTPIMLRGAAARTSMLEDNVINSARKTARAQHLPHLVGL